MSELSVTAEADPLAWVWTHGARCKGQTNIFFAPQGERPEAREVREQKARKIARYPRGEGMPVQPRPSARSTIAATAPVAP